jgi:hypothetical protein
MRLLRDVIDTLRSAPWFALGLLIALVAAGFNGLMVGFMVLGLQALLPGPFAQMGHFTEPHHRIHDLTFAFLFVPAIVGVLAQLRHPPRNVAAMWTALVPSAALVLTLLLTLAVGGNVRVLQPPWLTVAAGVLMATALHPAGGAILRVRVSRLSWPLLVLTLIAAAPLLAFAAANIGLQSTLGDEHAAAGHYGFMAAFAFTIIGIGLLASLRPVGWPVAAWIAGLLPVLLGASSPIYPDASSSLAPLWALAAAAWGAGYLIAAEVIRRRRDDATALVSPTELADEGATTARARGPASAESRAPGWLKVAGVIVGVAILVLVGIALMAGGHGPERFGPGGLGSPLWTARL